MPNPLLLRVTLFAISILFSVAEGAVANALQAYGVAAKDAVEMGPGAVYVRYLYLSEGTGKERKEAVTVLRGFLPHISKSPLVPPVIVVLANGEARYALSDNQPAPTPDMKPMDEAAWGQALLVRLSIKQYLFDQKTWDDLGFQNVVFNFEGTIDYGVTGADGKWTKTESKKVLAIAPQVAETDEQRANVVALVTVTQSRCPIIPCANFVWQLAIAEGRRVGYYRILGIKKRADFEKLVGFDRKLAAEYAPELFAVVANSRVAIEPRGIEINRGIGGKIYVTYDNKAAVKQNNPIRFPINDGFLHLAEEWFGPLPNGFWATGLFKSNPGKGDDGDTQNTAPDFVGGDRFTHNNDYKIHVGLSCLHCHNIDQGASAGLQDIKDSARNLYSGPNALQSPVKGKAVQFAQHYFQLIDPMLKEGRDRYTAALEAACGLKPNEWARLFRAYFARYDRAVDVATAAAELGTTEELMLERFIAMKGTITGLDPVLGFFIVDKARREPIPRNQWLEIYNGGQLALRGLAAWPSDVRAKSIGIADKVIYPPPGVSPTSAPLPVKPGAK